MPFRTQGQQMVGAGFEQPVRPTLEVFLMPPLPTQLSHLQLLRKPGPPLPTGPSAVFVSYRLIDSQHL